MHTTKDLCESLRRISADRERRIDERLDELLNLGRREFGLPIGGVARSRFGQLQLIRIVGGHGMSPGDVLPLCESFCEATLAEGRPVLIEHAGVSGWQDHPAYIKLRMECYAGVPLPIEQPGQGRIDQGTLCFMGPDPRPTPFTDEDVERLCVLADAAQALLGAGPV